VRKWAASHLHLSLSAWIEMSERARAWITAAFYFDAAYSYRSTAILNRGQWRHN
jgi:hypothetical protein